MMSNFRLVFYLKYVVCLLCFMVFLMSCTMDKGNDLISIDIFTKSCYSENLYKVEDNGRLFAQVKMLDSIGPLMYCQLSEKEMQNIRILAANIPVAACDSIKGYNSTSKYIVKVKDKRGQFEYFSDVCRNNDKELEQLANYIFTLQFDKKELKYFEYQFPDFPILPVPAD